MNKNSQEIWKELDTYFQARDYTEWQKIVSDFLDKAENLDELARSARTLFNLHSMNKGDSLKKKAFGYGFVSSISFIRINRLAPAMAIIEALRQIKSPEALLSAIDQEIAYHSRHKEEPVVTPPSRSTNQSLKSTLFDKLSALEIKEFCERAQLERLIVGECLFKEGDEANGFYVLAEGKLKLKSTSGIEVEFQEGDFFGELALLGDMKRTGTVMAIEKSTLLHYTKEQLVESFTKYPGFESKVLNFFYKRLFLSMTSKLKAFSDFSETELIDFFYLFKPLSVRKDAVLFKPGQPSSYFYFVIFGSVEVLFDDGTQLEIKASNFIGEMGYLDQKERNALVKTKTDCHLLRCEYYMHESIRRDFPKIYQMMQTISKVREDQNKNRAQVL